MREKKDGVNGQGNFRGTYSMERSLAVELESKQRGSLVAREGFSGVTVAWSGFWRASWRKRKWSGTPRL